METPEYFRLPSRGVDPHFGLTRSWYYAADKRGDIQLVRLLERGKRRGVTLISYDQIAAFIRSQRGPAVAPVRAVPVGFPRLVS